MYHVNNPVFLVKPNSPGNAKLVKSRVPVKRQNAPVCTFVSKRSLNAQNLCINGMKKIWLQRD